MNKISTYYKVHTELNGMTPSTGTVTCYDGVIIDGSKKDEPWRSQFIELADCHSKARIHRASYDTDGDWLMKVKCLKEAIEHYYEHLCQQYNKEHKSNDRT